MSIQLINQYYAEVEKIRRYGGSSKETALRPKFQQLLEHYARQKNLELIAELDYRLPNGGFVTPDGTLKDALRQDWGYWESKDEEDDLELEILKKFAKGYPRNNILFEDTHTAVLYQAGEEVSRADFLDAQALDSLLSRFVSYESVEVRAFREAIENFTADVPALAEELRELIRAQYDENDDFKKAADDFLELCQEAINPSMGIADVREMIVQHVLTEDIFITVFSEPQFHRENVIAHELGEVVDTFYKGDTRRRIDGRIQYYTRPIKARAAQIYNHQEKQKFLKVLYENFYKAYNPDAADRLGIIYTPNEIVRFMIESADQLCFKHFRKTLGDSGVEILDPAVGTGTYVTELIEYLPAHQLEHKYRQEIHCNEVSILSYYIANLNIEYTFTQKMGQYVPFENIVFVDTLDNVGFKTSYHRQLGMFGLTDENLERIQRQNKREISIIIGNPPYNANQLNENENNKNREYPEIDKRIKETYVKQSTAQKTKLYDMYARFYRWASDRLGADGIIAFVTNRSFLDARTFDGFRKIVADEFSHIYIVDLGGDVRKNPKLSGPKHNVFAIQTGVAIAFMVRRAGTDQPCQILYARRPEMEEAEGKLRFLAANSVDGIEFERISPSLRNNWLNLAQTNWDELVPVADKEFKLGKTGADPAIFRLFSLGVVTNRDDWVYDFSKTELAVKVKYFIEFYNSEVTRLLGKVEADELEDNISYEIKWTRDVKKDLLKGRRYRYDEAKIALALHRPYVTQYLYYDRNLNEMQYQFPSIFPKKDTSNTIIAFDVGNKPFSVLAADRLVDLHLNGDSQCLPYYRYDDMGNQVENITDWALEHFRSHYEAEEISKQDIFHYVYAVFHNPKYREEYKLNLRRDLPRVPLYELFENWALWGKALMELHTGFESVEPYPLERKDRIAEDARGAYRTVLRADKEHGVIELDTLTTLSGVPKIAWEYVLANRSALEWILERHKETRSRDPIIQERFNTYRFIDYKEDVIDLLKRVTTVSVETMKIVSAMTHVES